MDISIRIATKTDLPALYALGGSLGYKKEAGYFETCLADQAAGGRDVLAALGNDSLLGWGLLNWKPQYALYKKLNIPEIQDLNVVPQARRQGVATAMIHYCEDRALARGRTQIGISVGLYADYGPAQRLYAKLGYMPDGYGVTYDRQPVKPCEIRPVDDNLCLMMVKELNADR